ncbi:hypothetical protein N7492_001730 [Penicillium capsulatum]|uniref:FAD synthase n=1 Tax=Penicillium capsulatum TaxID=69766 RepID=A0A9W9IU88_9EURO|nr:hypothetical protein N7492_001730 [Penicillium capsulatum]KAJ6129219.1 hypothetical protein N7512_001999 [Penicillium capsulatum]
MAEPVTIGAPAPAVTASSRPQDHLRPFPPVCTSPTAQCGAGNASEVYTHATESNHQNGAVYEHAASETDETIPALPIVIARIHARVQAFLAEEHAPNSLLASVQHQTRTSLDVVAKALSTYKLSELSLSYNGGKDCLVLLILFLAGLHPYTSHVQAAENNDQDTTPDTIIDREIPDIPAIYALPPDPFPAVEDFVVSSASAYHLSITKYTTAPPSTTLRSSFEDYLAKHPRIRAIFVGTRRTDPHGARLTHFDRTDHGWPDFMRVHPVIDWHYAEIWAFIRHLGLTYCSLYDMGYTSLGGTSDTHPNPRLRVSAEANGAGEGYLPAYELTHDLEERLGRN